MGARAAGAATALVLARLARRVLVVDRDRYGADTLSTHALLRGGVLQLARWGLLPALSAADTPPVRAVSFHYADDVVTVPIVAKHGVDALYGPRRTVLDRLLVDEARRLGVDVVFGARLLDVLRDSRGRVTGVRIGQRDRPPEAIPASIVIGADGAGSAVASSVGARTYREGRHASAVVYGYWEDLGVAPGQYHWHFRPGASAGVIPTNGSTCVFAGVGHEQSGTILQPDREAAYLGALDAASPELGAAVRRARRAGPLRGFAGRPGFFRQSWGPGWALVGDAGYFKDPITAHGLTDALRDAEFLAGAVAAGTDEALASYQRTRDRLSQALFETTDTIASHAWTLEHLRALHDDLSRAMSLEVRELRAIDRGGSGSPAT